MTDLELYQRKIMMAVSCLFATEKNEALRKAYVRYLLCFQKRNANMTKDERRVARQPMPFLPGFEENKYWRFGVDSSILKKKIQGKMKYFLGNLFSEAVFKMNWLVVLNRGEHQRVIEDFALNNVKVILIQDLDNKRNYKLEDTTYCFIDTVSNTEILIEGYWMKVPELYRYDVGHFPSLSYLSERGLMPDYLSLVELYLNTVYQDRYEPEIKSYYNHYCLDILFQGFGARSFVPDSENKLWTRVEKANEKAQENWEKYLQSPPESTEKQLLDYKMDDVGTEMYRQLMIILIDGLKDGSDWVWPILWSSVQPYLMLKLLSDTEKENLKYQVTQVHTAILKRVKLLKEFEGEGIEEWVNRGHQLKKLTDGLDTHYGPYHVVKFFMLAGSWVDEEKRMSDGIKHTVSQLRSFLDTLLFYHWEMAYERLLEVVLTHQSVTKSDHTLGYLDKISKNMMPEGVTADCHSFPYAMNAIYHMTSHIMSQLDISAKVVCLQSVYFEMMAQLKTLGGHQLNVVSALEEIEEVPDFLIADMHTNNAISDRLHVNDVRSWLLSHVSRSTKDIHVLLDLTLNNPSETDVKAWIKDLHVHPQINLYIVISLTKLMQLGVDIISSGAVFVLGDRASLPEHLPAPASHAHSVFEILSDERVLDLRKTYFTLLRGNVAKLYFGLNKAFFSPKEQGLFRVGLCQDDKLVYVAIHLAGLFDVCDLSSFKWGKKKNPQEYIAKLVQDSLLRCAKMRNIRLSGRNSFGFSSSALNLVKSVLRLTGGIEPKCVVNEMIELISVFGNQLSLKVAKQTANRDDKKLTIDIVEKCLEEIEDACQGYVPGEMTRKVDVNITSEYREKMSFSQRLKITKRGILICNSEADFNTVLPASFKFYMDLMLGKGKLDLYEDECGQVELPIGLGLDCFDHYQKMGQVDGGISVSWSNDAIQSWSLHRKTIQVAVNLKQSGLDWVSYARTDHDQKRMFYNRFLHEQVSLERSEVDGGPVFFKLSFLGKRRDLLKDLSEIEEVSEVHKGLTQLCDLEKQGCHRYVGLFHGTLDSQYQCHLIKKAKILLNKAELASAPEHSLLLWSTWQALQIKKQDHLRGVLLYLKDRVDTAYLLEVKKHPWLYECIDQVIANQVIEYAEQMDFETWTVVLTFKNPQLKALLKDVIRAQLLEHMKRRTFHWEVEAFSNIDFEPDEINVWLQKQKKFNLSEYTVINQWLKNSIPSLSDMVHVGRGPHIDYFYSLTNFGKQHHSYLTEFWQNASTNFLDEIGFLTTLRAQDLEKSIIWRYRLSRVCADIAGDFKSMLSKIIEMKMACFSHKEKMIWLMRFSDYDDDVYCGYLYLSKGERALLGEWFNFIGLFAELESESFASYLEENDRFEFCQEKLSYLNNSLGLREEQIQLRGCRTHMPHI
jgi:hypothetical protein